MRCSRHKCFISILVWLTGTINAGNISNTNKESLELNGWFNCSAHSFAPDTDDEKRLYHFQCALAYVPLCHWNICTDNNNTRKIPIFVKRILTTKASGNAKNDKVLWVLQGGPGASSIVMETLMLNVYYETGGSISVYTMDHRGTGRSNRLACTAAQAMTLGSPGGVDITLDEYPQCLQDILFEIDGEPAAFSVTSAAIDLQILINEFHPQAPVYVYGASYGTYLVERFALIAPPSLQGLVLDGVVSQAAAEVINRHVFTNWDRDVSSVGERFLKKCAEDQYCQSKFNMEQISNFTCTVKILYQVLDSNSTSSSCASLFNTKNNTVPVSYTLRNVFATMLMNYKLRVLIPPLISRLISCKFEDIVAIAHFRNVTNLWSDNGVTTVPSQTRTMLQDFDITPQDLFFSEVLYYLIVFAEEWTVPSPTQEAMRKWFEDGIMGSSVYAFIPKYCMFTGRKREAACLSPLVKQLTPNSVSFTYQKDKLWAQSPSDGVLATSNLSVLILSGGLDAQTEEHYADAQLNLFNTTNKRLLKFENATHCTAFSTVMVAQNSTCGARILASLLQVDGDVFRINTTCMDKHEVAPLEFNISTQMSTDYFGVSEAYGAKIEIISTSHAQIASSIGHGFIMVFYFVYSLVMVGVLGMIVLGLVLVVVARSNTLQQPIPVTV